jgi:hypothetical protein
MSARKGWHDLDGSRIKGDENGRAVMLDLSSWRYSLKKLPHEIGTLSELKES